MKKCLRFISIFSVLALLLFSASVINASAEENICPICHKNCGCWEEKTVSPATCMSPRQVSFHCERFGYEETFEVGDTDPYNHTDLNYVKTVEPTCTESGYELYKCSDCSGEETYEIPPLHPEEHSYEASDVKCTDTTINYYCTVCGALKQEARTPTAHSYKADSFSCHDEFIDYQHSSFRISVVLINN